MEGVHQHPAGPLAPGRGPKGSPTGHQIATTKFPKSGSALEAPGFIQEGGGPRHARLERRLPAGGHVDRDGYRYAVVPPNSSRIMVANGQQSTDSLRAGTPPERGARTSGGASVGLPGGDLECRRRRRRPTPSTGGSAECASRRVGARSVVLAYRDLVGGGRARRPSLPPSPTPAHPDGSP